MSDAWAVAVALAAVAGALRPGPVPLLAAILAAGGALALRRPVLLCAGVALLASALGQRALDGLRGVEPAVVSGELTLITDPEPAAGGLRAEARLGDRRVEVRARGAVADGLDAALAGERFTVRGSIRPLPPDDWAVARHLAGRVDLHRLEPAGPPAPPAALANALRRALVEGARPLPAGRQALYAGLVVGDDRGQPPALTDAFRGAGLTHLLAVSGQNVAFVLALAGPVLRRLRLWPRLALSLALLGLFVVLTRAEPSVVRAGAMAAVATTSTTAGRPLGRVRTLALAVAVLVLVDPLLVRALGFRLSVAATAGIAVLAGPIAGRLRGPRWLAEPLAVTLAAQAAVAPFLVSTFGPLPLASLPANVLAVPAAGAVMGWGMSAGLVAGALGGPAAEVLHAPTSVLLWWVEEVATRAAAAPLGVLDGRGCAVVAVGAAVLLAAGRHRRRLRVLAVAAVAAVLLVTVASAGAPPGLRRTLAPGVVRWHRSGTDVVVLGGGGWRSSLTPVRALEALRSAGVGAVDLLVVADASVPARTVAAVLGRHAAGAIVVPSTAEPAERPPGAVVAPAVGTAVEVGALLVLLVPADGRLVVEAWPGTA